MITYNPLDKRYKSIRGGIPQEQTVTFNLSVSSKLNVDAVFFAYFRDGEKEIKLPMQPTENDGDKVTYSISLCFNKGLYWYAFVIKRQGVSAYVGRNASLQAHLYYEAPNYYQLLVYNNKYPVPNWLGEGVMYHIFVDRFFREGEDNLPHRGWGEVPYWHSDGKEKISTDFFGGNLDGVTKKLDYLQRLNVKVIYLSPIFEAESNHKYDTSDYEKIDSRFGTTQDFKHLCQEAQKRGMKIVLDGVFNHSGVNGKYFNKSGKYAIDGAWQGKTSPYADWFTFTDEKRTHYKSWWNIDSLPAHNPSSPSFRQYICGENGIVSKWITCGASGWRLDVVDELNDEFLDQIVASAHSANSQAAIIGEVWEDGTNKIAYGVRRRYFQGEQLDSVMNYPLKDAIIGFVRNGNCGTLSATMREILNNYPITSANNLMNILSSHDVARAITALGDEVFANGTDRETLSKRFLKGDAYVNAKKLLKMASAIQYTLVGFPSIYYGDEVGMSGYGDPFCRGCFPWDNIDEDLLEHYIWLGQLRKLPQLRKGDFEQLVTPPHVYAYMRSAEDKTILCIFNRSQENYTFVGQTPFTDLRDGALCSKYVVAPTDFAILSI